MNAHQPAQKPNVLFLCTGNACRSQMAEGFARHLHADKLNAYSAGVEPHGMNKLAMQVMAEAGMPIDQQSSKHVDTLADVAFDLLITVCGHAAETCPSFPSRVRRLHRGFEDPPRLARDLSDPQQVLNVYRKVRDDIRQYIENDLLTDLANPAAVSSPLTKESR